MQKVIVTLRRKDNSIIGEPIVREAETIDFEALAKEFDELVADPMDELETFQILGA